MPTLIRLTSDNNKLLLRPPPRPADHNARAVAQISLVDEYERVLANLYVKPEQPVVSYLTPLTGACGCNG